MTLTRAEKVRENRVRKMAERQGLRLSRSRSRDPLALDYGLYALALPEPDHYAEIGDGQVEAPLDEVERWLRAGRGRQQVQAWERQRSQIARQHEQARAGTA